MNKRALLPLLAMLGTLPACTSSQPQPSHEDLSAHPAWARHMGQTLPLRRNACLNITIPDAENARWYTVLADPFSSDARRVSELRFHLTEWTPDAMGEGVAAGRRFQLRKVERVREPQQRSQAKEYIRLTLTEPHTEIARQPLIITYDWHTGARGARPLFSLLDEESQQNTP